MSHGAPPVRGRAFGALRHRDFRLLWIGQIISHLGGWMHHTAESWLVYQLTGSPFLVGVTGLVRTIPFIVTSLYAGTVVDRVDRRKLLIWVEGLQMLVLLGIGVLIVGGWITIWHIYAASVITGILGAFDGPTRNSLLPYLVPREDLMTAISLQSIVRKGTQVIGPALGGLFIAVFDVGGAFFIHSATYLVLILCLYLMQTTNPVERGRETNALRSIADGFQYAYRERSIGTLLVLQSIVSMFSSTGSMMVVFAREVYETGPEGLGFLQSAIGLGAVLGSVGLAAMGDIHHKGRLLIGSGLAFGLSLVAFGAAPSFLIALPVLVIVGFSDMVFGTTKQTIVQVLVDRRFLGRVMSLNSVSMRGLGQMAGFQTGTLATFMGIQWAMAVGGFVCLAALMGSRLLASGLWTFTGEGPARRQGEQEHVRGGAGDG